MEGKLRPRRGCDSQESIRGLLFPTGNLRQPQNQKMERTSMGEKSVLLLLFSRGRKYKGASRGSWDQGELGSLDLKTETTAT